jgi:c(7)-type cytochrome triheme protein
MAKHWFWIFLLLILVPPSALHAVGMDGMGGMGGVGNMVNQVYIQTKAVGKVTFSHSVHGTRCSECHPDIFQKKSNSNHVSMKAMEKGRSCGACHNGKKAFSVTSNCVTCHAGDILFKEKDAGDVSFSHAVHLDMFSCDGCHPDLFKAKRGGNKASMDEMEKGKSCGACHDGSAAFTVAENCDSCHNM